MLLEKKFKLNNNSKNLPGRHRPGTVPSTKLYIFLPGRSNSVLVALKAVYYGSRFLLTRGAGRTALSLLYGSAKETKPLTSPIVLRREYAEQFLVWVRKKGLSNGFELLQTSLRTVAFTAYTFLSTATVFLMDFCYLYGRVLLESVFNFFKNGYVAGYEYLVSYFGALSDGFIIVYSLAFGALLVYLALKIFFFCYHIFQNIYYVFYLFYASLRQFIGSVHEKSNQDHTYFFDKVSSVIQRTELAKWVVLQPDLEKPGVRIYPLFDSQGKLIFENMNQPAVAAKKSGHKLK
jgi:hypothetical protein